MRPPTPLSRPRISDSSAAIVSESDYFERDWERSYWGASHARLAEVEQVYNPGGLFAVRNGVGEGLSR